MPRNYDSRAALDFIKETAKEPVKIGFSAMAIPLSRGEIDYAEELAKTMGMTPVDKEVIPPPTADYTPFATKLKDAGAELGLFVGAVGDAGAHARGAAPARLDRATMIAWAHLEAEGELRASRTASST